MSPRSGGRTENLAFTAAPIAASTACDTPPPDAAARTSEGARVGEIPVAAAPRLGLATVLQEEERRKESGREGEIIRGGNDMWG